MSAAGPAGAAGMPGPGDTFPEEGVALIRQRSQVRPLIAVVLGSGLGDALVDDIEVDQEFAFEALPGFSAPAAPGHAGRLILGQLHGLPSAVFRGRLHYYEGHGMAGATLIPRLAASLGASTLILTSAAGGLEAGRLRPGQLLLVEDHLNSLGVDPMSGWRWPEGTPAFLDLSSVYDPELVKACEVAAQEAGVDIVRGVYAARPGPSFETPAEARFLSRSGADAVGMSMVPESVVAHALGLSVLGICCITNIAGESAGHQDVLAAAELATPSVRAVLAAIVPQLGRAEKGAAPEKA